MLSYYQEGRFSADPLSPPSISPENRPVGAFSTRNNCLLAHFIVALNGFASQFGRDALADLIAALAQAHPPGGDPLTEEVVRRILHDRFGYDLPPPGYPVTLRKRERPRNEEWVTGPHNLVLTAFVQCLSLC